MATQKNFEKTHDPAWLCYLAHGWAGKGSSNPQFIDGRKRHEQLYQKQQIVKQAFTKQHPLHQPKTDPKNICLL